MDTKIITCTDQYDGLSVHMSGRSIERSDLIPPKREHFTIVSGYLIPQNFSLCRIFAHERANNPPRQVIYFTFQLDQKQTLYALGFIVEEIERHIDYEGDGMATKKQEKRSITSELIATY